MKRSNIIGQLIKNKTTFENLLIDMTPHRISWRPHPEKWSLLEIVCHLYDEEREDFQARIQHLISAPEQPFPSINPVAWVEERDYKSRNYQIMVIKFINERKQSILWLTENSATGFENGYDHPHFGRMTGDLLLANWLAHDYLHFRQIIRYHFQYLEEYNSESLDYAGGW